jgi:hypothetical protein
VRRKTISGAAQTINGPPPVDQPPGRSGAYIPAAGNENGWRWHLYFSKERWTVEKTVKTRGN